MKYTITRPNHFDLFKTFFSDFDQPITHREGLEVYEKDNQYFLEYPLPGFTKEQIKVDFVDNTLKITAEKQIDEETEKGKHYYVKSTRKSKIERSFMLENVDVAKVSGQFENGILKLTLPKLCQIEPVSTQIQID